MLTIFCRAMLLPPGVQQDTRADIFGTWTMVPARSTDLATWRDRRPVLTLVESGAHIIVRMEWMEGKRRASLDSCAILPGGQPTTEAVTSPLWHENWYMGVLALTGSRRSVRGEWTGERTGLRIISDQTVLVSQGETTVRSTREYRVSPDGATLTVTERRSSRPTPVVMVFERVKP
jgi:hypothetical protein